MIIISSYKNPLTDYGKEIKIKLLEIGKTQNWLIDELKIKTGMFVDCSVLNKVMTGRVQSKKLTKAINEILDI